jgi:hypothetical protein
MKTISLWAAVLACAAATAAPGAVLYKSVAANGTVEFSDLVPEKGRNVERIRIPDTPTSGAPVTVATGPSSEEQLRETDAAVARANAQLDLAEHALAEARRSVVNDSESLRMVSTRMSRADSDRLAFYKKDVLLARAQLLEVLKEKRKAAVPQTFTASNEWVPFNPGARR